MADQIERIKGLYRLAEGTTFPDEAVSARNRARQLQLKYGVTDSMLKLPGRLTIESNSGVRDSEFDKTCETWQWAAGYAPWSTTATAEDARAFADAIRRANPRWKVYFW